MKIIPCQGTFNFKGSNVLFSSFVCRFSRTLCSLSVTGKQEQAELHAVLRTEMMGKSTCLDSLQWPYLKVIYSVTPLLLKILNAFWPFEDCYLLGFVLVQFFYCLKLPCMKIYKQAPLFHSRLGSPVSFFSSTPVPMSGSTKTMTNCVSLNKQDKYNLRSCNTSRLAGIGGHMQFQDRAKAKLQIKEKFRRMRFKYISNRDKHRCWGFCFYFSSEILILYIYIYIYIYI